MSISEMQAQRKRNELEPRDWNVMREALVASGWVEERRLEREEGNPAGTVLN